MSAEDMGDYKEFPTKESALDWLDNYLSLDERNNLIRALEQEPILDKIRAEIEEYRDGMRWNSESLIKWEAVNYVLEHIIDKYKAESEDKE